MVKAELVKHNGSPAISINGEIFPPMMMTVVTTDRKNQLLDENYFRELGKSGIRVFFLICDTEWLRPGAFEQFKTEAEMLLRAVPDAYIMARIGMHPPVSWCEENPDELVQYSDGVPKKAMLWTESYEAEYPAMYSLCSQKWREDAGNALLETCRELEKLPFADRIAGFFFAAGGTSEWYYITPTEYTEKTEYLDTGGFEQQADPGLTDVYGDLSPAFRRSFRAFLTEKYGTDEALRRAWRDPDVTLENPRIPDCEGRYFVHGVDYDIANPGWVDPQSGVPEKPNQGSHVGQFLDVDRYMDVYDFYRAWHKGTADSIVYFGDLVKKHCPGKLTGAFYGSCGSVKYHCMGQIGSVTHILNSGTIDFLASPGVYENRQPGGFTGQRQFFDSYRLKNRMFIVEEDARTHHEHRYYQNYFELYDVEDTCNILKRDFGRNICMDLNAWWFDQLPGGKRYKDPVIYGLFARQQQIAAEAYTLDRRKCSEVAFIYDEDSFHLVSHETDHQLVELFNNYEIDKLGLPADRYYKSDFFDGNMPEYKLYVFLNCLCFNDREREAVQRKLRRNHATALYLYGCGMVDFEQEQRISPENVSKTVGMQMAVLDGVYRGKFKINGAAHPLTEKLDKGEIYGDFTRKMWANISQFMNRIKTCTVDLFPVVYSDDPEATVLAYFLDSKLPALSVKEQDGYTSIYCGSKYLSCEVIKEAARFAGCHIYSETDDVFYANRNYITVHAAKSGVKTITLPETRNVYDAYSGECCGKGVTSFQVPMLKGQTRMFRVV